MASEPARPATIRRFGRTERVAHWLLAATFLAIFFVPLFFVLVRKVTRRGRGVRQVEHEAVEGGH